MFTPPIKRVSFLAVPQVAVSEDIAVIDKEFHLYNTSQQLIEPFRTCVRRRPVIVSDCKRIAMLDDVRIIVHCHRHSVFVNFIRMISDIGKPQLIETISSGRNPIVEREQLFQYHEECFANLVSTNEE